MKHSWELSRRHFLKGLGAAMALPALDVMMPVKALGASAASQHPLRMAFFFVPNGVHMPDWRPEKTGANFDLPYILEPLKPVQKDLIVMSGLTHDKGRANGDGAGDHARSGGVFLTGSQPLKSEGSEIRAGVSVDQYAAEYLKGATRFPSMEIGTETGRPYGKCDSGYSCGYSNNMSWKDASTPVAKIVNPREVFERLFANELQGEVSESQTKRLNHRRSILDFVMDDAKRLEKKVGRNDQQKLDEYLTSVREIEQRIERAEKPGSRNTELISDYEMPLGVPDTMGEHMRLLGDMMVLAFQTDVTRVCSFMVANAGSNRSYREINVNDGHHDLSHHQGDPGKHAKIRDINRFHVAQFSYILQRLKSIPEGEGTLLDHSMIVYGSAISDGNRHNHDDLPVVFAGNAGGAIQTGRHLEYHNDTPMCNLFNSMLDLAGVPVSHFGDSTGRLRYFHG